MIRIVSRSRTPTINVHFDEKNSKIAPLSNIEIEILVQKLAKAGNCLHGLNTSFQQESINCQTGIEVDRSNGWC